MSTGPTGVKTYRAGATVWTFLLWACGAAAGAFFAERHALSLPTAHPDRWVFHMLAGGAILLGPAAFTLHLLRRIRVRVTLDPDQGLILPSGEWLPWEIVAKVDHRPGPLRHLDTAPTVENPWRRRSLFRDGPPPEAGSRGLVLWLAFCIFYYTLYPPLLTLFPWHPRIIVYLKDHRKLVLRDLEDDGEFVFRVKPGPEAPREAGSPTLTRPSRLLHLPFTSPRYTQPERRIA